MNDLPQTVVELADLLAAIPGAVAVALGGSRALSISDEESDWDLGLYYRGSMDFSTLAAHGTVFPPGSWGRLMNGGAWLRLGKQKVDVIFRDLDVVEYWTRRAENGEFERDALLGYLAGVPTYILTAELASCRALCGTIPTVAFPSKLMLSAPPIWRFCRSFSLDYARMHARRGNVVGATAQTATAIMQEAHAILCQRGQWICNEKRLIEAAGLSQLHTLFVQVPNESTRLVQWINLVATQLGVPEGELRPWK